MSEARLTTLTVGDNVSFDGIARIAHDCRKLFQGVAEAYAMNVKVISRVNQLLKLSVKPQTTPVTLDDLNDEYEQFRVWARNLGVFASDHASLDYRLREAEEVRSGIIGLLRGFQADLDAIQFLLYQDRVLSEATKDDSSEETDSDSDESETLDDIGRSAFEFQARLQRVISTVNKLMQIAEVIRASNPRSRMTKAANYVHYESGINVTEQFEKEYLPLLLEHRYKVKTSLIERLVKAVSLRRRKFQYQAKHQKRLAYPGEHDFEFSRTNPALEHRRAIPVGAPRDQQKSPQAVVYSGPASNSNVLTVATTFKKLQVRKTAPSTIISASTKSTAANPEIPPPPWIPARATHFQCPYCCILMPERNFLLGRGTFSRHLWIKHVITDLQPYICLEDECPTPHVSLETHDEWLDHQKWQHAMEWWCEGDDLGHEPLKFDTADKYIQHSEQIHGQSHESASTQASVAGRPSIWPFNACPFCDFDPYESKLLAGTKQEDDEGEPNLSRTLKAQDILQRHIADELLNIFLIALPERDDIKDIQTETGRPVVKGSTVKALDDISLAFSNAGDSAHLDNPNDRFPFAFELSLDPYPIKTEPYQITDWEDVWTSPQLQQCVRSTYPGFEHDERLQEMVAIKDRDNDAEAEIELWIPSLVVGDEVLVQGKRLPPGIKNYHDAEPLRASGLPTLDFVSQLSRDTPSGGSDLDRPELSSTTEDGRTSYAAFFLPESMHREREAAPSNIREVID